MSKNQASVITLSDLMRIQNTIVPAANSMDSRKQLDTSLKALSQSKIKNWPDSVEMAKKNQLESRKKVFFEKESEKRRIDEEERKYQEMQKKLTIEKANKQLFEAQGPVKAFNSKLLCSDVLKEREYQKEITERKKEMQDEIERRWFKVEQQKMEDYDRREQIKFQEEQMKKTELANIINQQFHDLKVRKIKDYQDKVIEGEMIKRSAIKAIQEEKDKEEQRRRKNKEQQEEFKKANEELEKLKELKRQKEKVEEKKIEEFAIKKQQLGDLRKRKEEEKFKEKQDRRQKLIDIQIEKLKQIKNREDEILAKNVKEAEEKRVRNEEDKRQRFLELKRQMDENRDLQTQRKRFEKEQEKKEDLEFVENWKKRMEMLVNLFLINLGTR